MGLGDVVLLSYIQVDSFSSTRKRDQMLKANAACNASSKSGPITPLRREGLSAHHKYKPEQCNDQEAPFQVLSLSDCLRKIIMK